MQCYCAKIESLQKELEDLKQSKVEINKVMNDEMIRDQAVRTTASQLVSSFKIEGTQDTIREDLITSIVNIFSSVKEAKVKVDSEISLTEDTINKYKQEDKDYHKKQEKEGKK